MNISPKLMERFCKDCNLPIKLFQEPYFTERLRLYDPFYGCISKWETFLKEYEKYPNEEAYYAEYNRVKDDAIHDIKSCEAWQQFNEIDMNQFAVTHKNLPSKDIFKPSNDGRTFISIDMKKANFSALKHYNPHIFDETDSWEHFISYYTQNPHIRNSKYIRQVILGNCNPKRHITYEKYLMDDILSYIVDEFVPITDIVFFSNDEIVIDISDKSEEEQTTLAAHIENTINSLDIPLRTELFVLHAIHGTNGYFKEKQDGTIEFKCLDAYVIPFVIRAMKDEPVEENDKVFYHEGLLSKFMETPTITIPERKYKNHE